MEAQLLAVFVPNSVPLFYVCNEEQLYIKEKQTYMIL